MRCANGGCAVQKSRVSTAPYVTPGRFEACDTNKRAGPFSPPVKKEHHSLYVCAIVVVPFLSRMPLQLYDLPFDMLEMIGKSYDDLGSCVSSCMRSCISGAGAC